MKFKVGRQKGRLPCLKYLSSQSDSRITCVTSMTPCGYTRSMMSMGQPLWDDITILGHVSMSVCLYVCLCVCGTLISNSWAVPCSLYRVYVCLLVCLSVCMWDIDIKNLMVSHSHHTVCSMVG